MPNLATLPPDHPLRNRPLAEIGARWRGIKEHPARKWQLVKPGWRISKYTYNDLDDIWLKHTEWEAEDE